jgi:hypothetical protein
MHMTTKTDLFSAITANDLVRIQGGASRVRSRSSSSSDQLTMMLSQITNSIRNR